MALDIAWGKTMSMTVEGLEKEVIELRMKLKRVSQQLCINTYILPDNRHRLIVDVSMVDEGLRHEIGQILDQSHLKIKSL